MVCLVLRPLSLVLCHWSFVLSLVLCFFLQAGSTAGEAGPQLSPRPSRGDRRLRRHAKDKGPVTKDDGPQGSLYLEVIGPPRDTLRASLFDSSRQRRHRRD